MNLDVKHITNDKITGVAYEIRFLRKEHIEYGKAVEEEKEEKTDDEDLRYTKQTEHIE